MIANIASSSCHVSERSEPIVMGADTVFISYSHDSAEHLDRVLAFSNNLRELGVDAELDQYHTRPPHGWPQWCEEQLRPENSKFVLLVCTPNYRAGVENKVPAGERRGVYWEGRLIQQYIYEEKANERFIPVLLGDEPDDSIPISLQGFAKFRARAFELSGGGFEALYRELTGQPAIIKPALGAKVVLETKSPAAPVVAAPLSAKPALTTFSVPPSPPPADISRVDRYVPAELIGREAETALIDDAWAKAVAGEPHPRVMTFVALGGEGKTALVAKWAIGQAEKDWPGCEAAFAWSFYSQGTREQQAASSDLFLAEALTFFGAPVAEGVESPQEKGQRLVKWISDKRAVLILDGLEPLQYAPTSPLAGRLKDGGLSALLRGLAQRNNGLCLVTTRYKIKDLEPYVSPAPQYDLAPLSSEAGARLLDSLGVRGTQEEREKLSEDVKGHALTLNIIGSYLRDAYSGDIRQRDRIKLEEADAEEQAGHAFRAMDAYVRWFESEGERGARALAMLRLVGLFDGPADARCLGALWKAPAIEGLMEPLTSLTAAQRNVVLSQLENAKLVTVNRDTSGAFVALDAHPLVREYFGKALREGRPEAWKDAHWRLYEHLTATTQDKPAPTLDDLQPLYQAVAHGCHAGQQQETCNEVFLARISGGKGYPYSVFSLGAYGTYLGAISSFFDAPEWRHVSPNLSPNFQAWLVGEAAFCLSALGRLNEALEPMRLSVDLSVRLQDWPNSAISYTNLSRLELRLGSVDAAVRNGETGLGYANISGEPKPRALANAMYADALHQAGRREEAASHFLEAKHITGEALPRFPNLSEVPGFTYCDLLLGDAKRAAWRRLLAVDGNDNLPMSLQVEPACSAAEAHATQTLWWSIPNKGLLDIGFDHLTLARSQLYRAILRDEAPVGDHMKHGMYFLRRAGADDFVCRALLTRALWGVMIGDFNGTREDLDAASEIAERGPMRLHLADIHLHRARLFGLLANRPAKYPWDTPRDDLDKARKLIEDCGYGRRREELDDAEAAWRRIYGATTAPEAPQSQP